MKQGSERPRSEWNLALAVLVQSWVHGWRESFRSCTPAPLPCSSRLRSPLSFRSWLWRGLGARISSSDRKLLLQPLAQAKGGRAQTKEQPLMRCKQRETLSNMPTCSFPGRLVGKPSTTASSSRIRLDANAIIDG